MSPAELFLLKQEGEGLDGLPQAHVIGEASSEAELLQKIEPLESRQLIRTKRCRETVRQLLRIDSPEFIHPFLLFQKLLIARTLIGQVTENFRETYM